MKWVKEVISIDKKVWKLSNETFTQSKSWKKMTSPEIQSPGLASLQKCLESFICNIINVTRRWFANSVRLGKESYLI
jgi:hypothetical protein